MASPARLERYLPLFDPDHFSDISFYEALAAIGYRQVLLGGTGSANLAAVTAQIRDRTALEVVLYPGGPGAVVDADLVVLPDVMNSNSHYARPFGSGPIATAAAVAQRGLDYLAIAYLIMGKSTAGWFYDATALPSDKVVLAYANYAKMIGYDTLALDYEGPDRTVSAALIDALSIIDGLQLVVSDTFTPDSAARALQQGVDTIVTPSNIYEEADDPVALAVAMHARLLADAPRLHAVAM